MRVSFILFIFSIISSLTVFSQESNSDTTSSDKEEYVVFLPTRELEKDIHRYLKIRHALIHLKTLFTGQSTGS
jgi:hypothetical protein